MSTTVLLKRVVNGVPEQTSIVVGPSTVRVRHVPGVRHTLDALDNLGDDGELATGELRAPLKVFVRQVGEELRLWFGEGAPLATERQPDLVIEGLSRPEELDLYGVQTQGWVERYALLGGDTAGNGPSQWVMGDAMPPLLALQAMPLWVPGAAAALVAVATWHNNSDDPVADAGPLSLQGLGLAHETSAPLADWLQAFDDNQDGQLNTQDARFVALSGWQDHDGDGVASAAELQGLLGDHTLQALAAWVM